jgi:hypothetical protein
VMMARLPEIIAADSSRGITPPSYVQMSLF